MTSASIVRVAKKECAYLDEVCFDTGKPCHAGERRCEKFEAWIVPLGKYKKEIRYYLNEVVG